MREPFALLLLASTLTTSGVNQFLRCEFDTMDWFAAPHGLLGYTQHKEGKASPQPLDPRDYFCQPAVLRKLGEFAHRPFVAIGCSDAINSAQGFTIATFLDRCATLESARSPCAWLDSGVGPNVSNSGVQESRCDRSRHTLSRARSPAVGRLWLAP